MRRTLRQLSNAQPAKYLEAGAPTGFTGLFTHPSPRSSLLYIYHSTLEALSKLPENSVYRQSTEALTKHRMAIVASVEPPGLSAYSEKIKAIIKSNPWAFQDENEMLQIEKDNKKFLVMKQKTIRDDLTEEWNGRKEQALPLEGTRSAEERAKESNVPDSEIVFKISERIEELEGAAPGSPEADELAELWKKLPQTMENAINKKDGSPIEIDPEPQLTVEQIEEIENKVGAGLIEEVIQVAEGELRLVDIMLKAQVWEDLEEKPSEDQWTYFQRATPNNS